MVNKQTFWSDRIRVEILDVVLGRLCSETQIRVRISCVAVRTVNKCRTSYIYLQHRNFNIVVST